MSTNRFHETWHIVTSPDRVRALRTLLWALATDRHADTAVVLTGSSLARTPFDAAPSRPVVLACSDRAHLSGDDVRRLLDAVRSTSSYATVKLPRASLARAGERRDDLLRSLRWVSDDGDLRVTERGGAIFFAGTSAILRRVALTLSILEKPLGPRDSDQEFLGPGWPPPGEVQVFGDYRRMLQDALAARRAVLGDRAGVGPGPAPRAPDATVPLLASPELWSEIVSERRAQLSGDRWRRAARRARRAARLRGQSDSA